VSSTIIPSDSQSPFDAIKQTRPDGSEYWSARDLMPFLGYRKWERFVDAVDQARTVIDAEDGPLAADREASRCREAFGRTKQVGDNVHLSRRACYLTAMRGDSRKPEIRAALIYFATKTREAEVAQAQLAAAQPNAELEMAKRVIGLQDQVLALATSNADMAVRLADMAPKAEGYDDLIAAEGLFDMATAAKILAPVTGRMGRTRFLNQLRGMRVIIQNSTLPYQHLIDRGYFAVRTDVVNGKARPATVVTAKGLRWLQAEFREEHPTLNQAPQRNVVQLPQQRKAGELA
jgi:DNA-damage-inducible protein D